MSTLCHQATDLLLAYGLNPSDVKNNTVRTSSVLYQIYWLERLKNNQNEYLKIKNFLKEYSKDLDVEALVKSQDYPTLVGLSQNYVGRELLPVKTVDLVIEPEDQRGGEGDRKVLLYQRDVFPSGLALPGGLVLDTDETNSLNIESDVFAALRVGADKLLNLSESDRVYEIKEEIKNNEKEISYIVKNKKGDRSLIIYPKEVYGYNVKENIYGELRPLDPRHLVDTVGFRCKVTNPSLTADYVWESKKDLLEGVAPSGLLQNNISKKYAFNHHKEIVLHMLAKTSTEREKAFNEKKFIRSLVNQPLKSYQSLLKRFEENHFNPNTSFPELFPSLDKMLHEMFSDEVNNICSENKLLIGIRDKAVNSLRHCALKNRVFCPYRQTLEALFKGVAFFDVISRLKKDFYSGLESDKIIEHDPKTKENASYHMYKYEYRMHELLNKMPFEILIPTFSNLSATDLMKVRGVPIRFVGLATDFIFVDEFEQSPEEFLMHDINHSWRMNREDEKYCQDFNVKKSDFLNIQNRFVEDFLPTLKINETDTELQKELKKIKKIILFELCHEDTRPLIPEALLDALLKQEGGETSFEMPTIDEKTHYMDIVDVLDTEISPLSYVRNKLQCGFYDKIDKQNSQIVGLEYRKSQYIAQSAMDLANTLNDMFDLKRNMSNFNMEYFLKRVCSVGPQNVNQPKKEDEGVEEYGDGAQYVNPKRYQSKLK